MDKEAVVERYIALLNELNEPARNLVLSAGSALVVLGVRETTADLDVDVPEGVFRVYERSGKFPVAAATVDLGKRLKFDADVDLHILDEDRGLACLNGVWIYSPTELLVQKRYLSKLEGRDEEKRAADLLDIAALETLIKGRNYAARVMA